MLHIVQYSGGVGSAMAAYLVAQKQPKNKIILLFHDVPGGHDEDMYRFNDDVSNFLGLTITDFTDGRTIWEIIDAHHSLPSVFIPFCTDDLKQKMGKKFCKDLNCEYTLYSGFCYEEKRRVDKARSLGYAEYPVFDAGLTSKQCKEIIANKWGIKLPRVYEHFEHNNCIPCWKSGSKIYWRKVWEYFPERYQLAIEAEERIGHTHFKHFSLKQLSQIFEMDKKRHYFRRNHMPILTVYADGTVVGDIFANTAKYNAHSSPDWAERKAQIAYENDHKFDDLPRRYVSRPSIMDIFTGDGRRDYRNQNKKLTPEEDQYRRDLYASGKTDYECAKLLDIDVKKFRLWRRSRGIVRHKHDSSYTYLTNRFAENIYNWYLEGKSFVEMKRLIEEIDDFSPPDNIISIVLQEYMADHGLIESKGKNVYLPKTCPYCEAVFTPKIPTQKFCSRSCKGKARYHRHKLPERICIQCGKTFEPREARELMCSEECKRERRIKKMKTYRQRTRRREEAKALATQAN